MKKSKLGSLCQAPYEGHEVKVKRQRFRMPREGDELRYEGDAADLVYVTIPVEMLKDKEISGDALKLYAILKAIAEGKIKGD